MREVTLTFLACIVSVASGFIAHCKTDKLIAESTASDNFKLPARYVIGWVSSVGGYLLLRELQDEHYKDGKVPHIRKLGDFIFLGFLVGTGVMIGRMRSYIAGDDNAIS